MLSTSIEFRRKIAQNSKVLFKATLTLADDTVRELVGDDIVFGTAKFEDAVSSSDSFDIGAAIINRFDVSLNNADGRFNEYDFTGATIVPYVGVELDDGTTEWLRKGFYGVDQPETYGMTIGISALDNMRLLERPYSDVSTTYPASLQTIVVDICEECGIILKTTDFDNCSYSVAVRPDESATSCLDVVSYAAQASGNFARVASDGQLVIDWYNTSVFEGEDWLDGDRFDDDTPYSSGDTADGGNFDDYTSGDAVNGGNFDYRPFAVIHAISSSAIFTDDVVVTGVSVTERDVATSADGDTYLSGSEGYVLSVAGNPLIQAGRAQAVASQIAARVVGMQFRPFDLSAVGDPSIEAGDPVVIADRENNQYRSYTTSLSYKIGSYEAFRCGAETPSRNSAAAYGALTKAVVQSRNAVKTEKTARELAVANLARQLAEAPGLFLTEEQQQGGSTIYYLHDKPTLAESQIVWKLTSEAFAISTDGGVTYPFGFDAWGTAILSSIYAIGINADYITTGKLSVKTPGGVTRFEADMLNSSVRIGGFTVGNKTIYNGYVTIDDVGLHILNGFQEMGSLTGSLQYESTKLVGMMNLNVPGIFKITSRYADEPSATPSVVMQYTKSADKVTFYPSMQVQGTFKCARALQSGAFTVNGRTFTIEGGLITAVS